GGGTDVETDHAYEGRPATQTEPAAAGDHRATLLGGDGAPENSAGHRGIGDERGRGSTGRARRKRRVGRLFHPGRGAVLQGEGGRTIHARYGSGRPDPVPGFS